MTHLSAYKTRLIILTTFLLKTTTTRTLLRGTLTVTLIPNTQVSVNSGPVTTATIPYIRGTSETIARILQP